MKPLASMLALAMVAALPVVAPAQAGSAEPGGVRIGRLSPSAAPLVRRLTGRWQLVAFETNGRPTPVPGNIRYVLVLGADGIAKMEVGRPTPRSQVLGRWQLQGRRIAMTTKTKTEAVDFVLAGDRLTITTPGTRSRTRLVLQRMRPRPRRP